MKQQKNVPGPATSNELAISTKALALKGEINALHRETLKSGNEMMRNAVRCGQLLSQVKEILKASKTTTFENWVGQNLDVSYRSVRSYMLLSNKLEELQNWQSSAILQTADSISEAFRLIEHTKPPVDPAPQSNPPSIPTSPPPASPPVNVSSTDDDGRDGSGGGYVENMDADPPPPEEIPTPQASVVLDCFDRPIPDKFREAHDTAALIASQARRLDPILRELLSLTEQPGGEYLPRSTMENDIKALKGAILGACYGFECPKCQGVIGKPCKFCHGRGWAPVEKKGKLSASDKAWLGID